MSAECFKVWRVAGASGIELMDVTASDRCWRVVHDRLCVSVCLAGATEYRYRGTTYAKSAGVATVHEPGEAYAARQQHQLGAASVLSIAPAVVEGWADREQLASAHFVPEPGAERGLVQQLLRLAWAIRTDAPSVEIDERIGEAMGELFTNRAELAPGRRPRTEHRAVGQVKARLHDALHENISLDQLAADVGLHKVYLLSVFREQVGVPPHAYQLQLRVAHARTMLAAGTPILEVVTKLGFSDQSHLGRHFRRTFGVSPGAYVKLHCAASNRPQPR